MTFDTIIWHGRLWLDAEQASMILGIKPDSLRRNRNTCRDLRGIDTTIWHGILLYDAGDVMDAARGHCTTVLSI